MGHWLTDTDRARKACPAVTSFTTNPTSAGLGLNRGFRGKRRRPSLHKLLCFRLHGRFVYHPQMHKNEPTGSQPSTSSVNRRILISVFQHKLSKTWKCVQPRLDTRHYHCPFYRFPECDSYDGIITADSGFLCDISAALKTRQKGQSKLLCACRAVRRQRVAQVDRWHIHCNNDCNTIDIRRYR